MKAKPNIIGIIPARYGAERLPGKPLADINGKPMIIHVIERSLRSKLLKTVIVATDNTDIMNCVHDHGYEAVMTRKDHKSGTDRVAEAAKYLEAEIVVNIQGDEPMIDHRNIDKAVRPMIMNKNINVSTLCTEIISDKDIMDPDIVKVIIGKDNYAIYFSRHPIPYRRNETKIKYYKHIGLYVFRLGYLFKFIHMKESMLEKAEKLEQLRILEKGDKIYVVKTKIASVSVDTKSDLNKVRKLLKYPAIEKK